MENLNLNHYNRNTRWACFEVLKSLGELQVVVNGSHFGEGSNKKNPMTGWGYVSLVGDLSQIIPSPVPEKCQQLVSIWKANWKNIEDNEDAAEAISEQIDACRLAILDTLNQLK